MFPYIKSS